jgi:hypothetical protein
MAAIVTQWAWPGAVLRLVARASELRNGSRFVRVPPLRVTSGPATGAAKAWFLCPHWDQPSGGVRKMYRWVDLLTEAGLPATIVHEREGFSCSWFEHTTPVTSSSRATLAPHDVLVVPEVYAASIRDLPRGIRQVILNQNVYNTVETLGARGREAAAYLDNPDLQVVAVVSADNESVFRYAFPGVHVRRIRLGIDPAVYHPTNGDRARCLAYMPRRRAGEAAQVLALLGQRGVLDGWDVVAIGGRCESEVAELLQGSRVFMSLSQREGFGLPPLEALACGSLVVGYPGFGGREFFRPPFAVPVEDGDVVAFARAVEDMMRLVDDDTVAAGIASHAGAEFVRTKYSCEAEQADLLDLFAPLLDT